MYASWVMLLMAFGNSWHWWNKAVQNRKIFAFDQIEISCETWVGS